MRVAQVIGKLAAAGVEAVVNNYYCSMNTERIQFDYFIDEDSELAPPQEMIDRLAAAAEAGRAILSCRPPGTQPRGCVR